MRYSNWTDQADYRYVAFIDESGDTGLNLVKPMDPNGASEWLIIGAVVVRAEHEAEMSTWLTDITSQLKGHQRPGIHFADLRKPAKKRLVCSMIADLPMRIFAMTSNKKNMKGYANPFAGSIPSDNWFYCWMTRILLERVTHFVKTFGDAHGAPGKLKIVFSERGGLSYSQMNAYYSWLQWRNSTGSQFLRLGDLAWDVMDRSLLEVHPHEGHDGLHFADVAASAFYAAIGKHDMGPCAPEFAKLLQPRMARFPDGQNGLVSGYGLKLLPAFKTARLDADQQEIFKFYGYPEQWWAPGTSGNVRPARRNWNPAG